MAHDPWTQRVLITNGNDNSIDAVCINDPTMPTLEFSIDLSAQGGGANSVAVRDGLVAVAVEAEVKQDPGSIVFFGANDNFINLITAGALPDMVAFTPNGRYLLSANKGEPNDEYTDYPMDSVAIVPV